MATLIYDMASSICPWQKQSQRDLAGMRDLMEICCLWEVISPKIQLLLGHDPHTKICEMFLNGWLVRILISFW